jgi:hypothetical protein
MVRDARISLRLEQKVKDALDTAATREHRNLTNLIEKILIDWLKGRGYLDE